MLLDRREAQLFTQTKMLLEMEANKRLKVLPYSLRYEEPSGEDEAELLDAIWSTPSVIADIAKALPSATPQKIRDLLGSWTRPLYGEFAVVKLGAEVLFLGYGHAFAVSGITRSIPSVLGAFPCFVQTALLPMRNLIVYDGSMQVFDVAASERMAEALQEEAAQCRAEGKIVRSGKELFRMAPTLIEEEKNRQDKESIPVDENDTEGFHRGALAGLAGEERARAIREQEDGASPAAVQATQDYDARFIRHMSLGDTPTHEVGAGLSGLKKHELLAIGRALGLKGLSKLRKEELAARVAQGICGMPGLWERFLPVLTPSEIESVRKILAEGGEKTFDLASAEEAHAAWQLPQAIGIGGFFVSGDRATYLLTEPLIEMAGSLDWEKILDASWRNERICQHLGAALRLRGIMDIVRAAAEFGEGLSASELADMLTSKLARGIQDFDLVFFEDEEDMPYLVDGILDDISQHERGISSYKAVLSGIPRDSVLGGILALQDGKDPYPVPEGVETPDDVYEWIYGLPATEKLHSYLDEHVPDGEDDYSFADGAIEDLVPLMQLGIRSADSFRGYMDALSDWGFIPNEGMVQTVIGLLMNMANSIPVWSNNGWPPQELFERDGGGKKGYGIDTAPLG